MTQWIQWNGGEAPLSDGTHILIRFRDGSECSDVVRSFWDWTHTGHHHDIMFYKVPIDIEEARHAALRKATIQLIGMQSLILASEHNGHKPSKCYPSYAMFQEALEDLQKVINQAREALSND